MKRVKRWRYYCEYCKKSGGSGGHISRHEKSCTLNPNRICNVCCKLLEIEQKPIEQLLAVLPNSESFLEEERDGMISYGPLGAETEKCMTNLRELTEGCPACIMSALRQAKIPVPLVESFNFTKEMGSIWSDINEANKEIYYGSYHL